MKEQLGRRNLLNMWNHGTQQGLSAGAVYSKGLKIRGCQ